VTLGPTPEKKIPYGPRRPRNVDSRVPGVRTFSLESMIFAACLSLPSCRTLRAVSSADLYGIPFESFREEEREIEEKRKDEKHIQLGALKYLYLLSRCNFYFYVYFCFLSVACGDRMPRGMSRDIVINQTDSRAWQ
jgi:hypothetical protein